MIEDELVGWHPGLNEHEFEQTLRDSEGQGGLVCCSPWAGCKEWDKIEWLNNNPSTSIHTNIYTYRYIHTQSKFTNVHTHTHKYIKIYFTRE